jgi:[ribosomal protein S5]-alanine N-acetyltransferase
MAVVTSVRPAVDADAKPLAALYTANREFLAPWEPLRDESFFTVDGQRMRLRAAQSERQAGLSNRCVIEDAGAIVGMVSLTSIERGPVQSAHLGYWVARAANGRGVATKAVDAILRVAFLEFALHRVEAGTLLHNTGSQKVLQRNGFERIGVARRYLRIAGQWQDHILFQRLAD